MARFILSILCLALLSACQVIKEADRQTSVRYQEAQSNYALAANPESVLEAAMLQSSDDVYLGSRGIRAARGQPLPPKLERPQAVTIISAIPLTLYEIGAEITQTTGIPVRIRVTPPAEVEAVPVETSGQQAVQPADGAAAPQLAPLPADFNLGGETGRETIIANWRAPLSTILNQIAAQFGLSWEYRDGQITFAKYRTRTFSITALPVDTTANSAISSGIAATSNGEDSADTTSQTSQNIEANSAINIWKEIEDAIKTIVPEGAKVAVAPANGTVTVTAPDDALESVEDYIKDMNKRFSRQVVIEVKVLSVDIGKSDNFSLDLRAAFEDMAKSGLGIAAGPAVPAATALGELSVGIVDPQSRFSGSQALISALSKQGKVAVLTETAVTTLNNQLVPVQDATQTSFLKEVSVAQVDGAGTVTSLVPGTVVTGFNLQLLPRILGNGEVLLQYSLNLSNLTALNEVASGDQKIQIPEIDSRGFSQQTRLRSGNTLVLTGFRKDLSSLDKQGIGDPSFWGLGGSQEGERNNTVIVIMITPKIVDLGF